MKIIDMVLLRVSSQSLDKPAVEILGPKVDKSGFSCVLEMIGNDQCAPLFSSKDGGDWVCAVDDFPYDLLIEMDPETTLKVAGKIRFSIRPNTNPGAR